jgi:hypothetical protein
MGSATGSVLAEVPGEFSVELKPVATKVTKVVILS